MAVLQERFLDGEVPVLVLQGDSINGWVVCIAPMYDGTTSVALKEWVGEPPQAMGGSLEICTTLEAAETILQGLCEEGGVVYPPFVVVHLK